jgi:hypothetical protein
MKIPVLGADPSLSNWGLARGMLDLDTGVLESIELSLTETKPDGTKDVRKNSKDLQRAEDIATGVQKWFKWATVVFVEVPVGSQSANAMKSYGLCIGILGAFRANGIQIIEVTPTENKVALTNNATASKDTMIKAAVAIYPEANWLKDGKGKLLNKNEHLADAVGAIHAGVLTPAFQTIMKLYSKV